MKFPKVRYPHPRYYSCVFAAMCLCFTSVAYADVAPRPLPPPDVPDTINIIKSGIALSLAVALCCFLITKRLPVRDRVIFSAVFAVILLAGFGVFANWAHDQHVQHAERVRNQRYHGPPGDPSVDDAKEPPVREETRRPPATPPRSESKESK